eukprot:3996723-Amphidinium_carterae.1
MKNLSKEKSTDAVPDALADVTLSGPAAELAQASLEFQTPKEAKRPSMGSSSNPCKLARAFSQSSLHAGSEHGGTSKAPSTGGGRESFAGDAATVDLFDDAEMEGDA